MLAMQIRALIRDCFREALDRKLFWVTGFISLLIILAMAMISFDEKGMHILFGMWNVEVSGFGRNDPFGRSVLGSVLTKYICDLWIGFIAIVISLVANCGIFPSLLERGSVDVVLSKPISRPMLFLGKYLGAMAFVTLQAAFFVVGTFLVVGTRWGHWLWGYLWCIPLIVVLFSYVFAFCALFGVMTRSAMASLLFTFLAWFVVYVPQGAHEAMMISLPAMGIQVDPLWIRLNNGLRAVLPKTTEITYIAGNLIGAATATELIVRTSDESDQPAPADHAMDISESDRFEPIPTASPATRPASGRSQSPSLFGQDPKALVEGERKVSRINPWQSIGSSLLFEALIVALAMRRFSRMDF